MRIYNRDCKIPLTGIVTRACKRSAQNHPRTKRTILMIGLHDGHLSPEPLAPFSSPSPDGLTLRAFSKASHASQHSMLWPISSSFFSLCVCSAPLRENSDCRPSSPAPARFILHHFDFILSPKGGIKASRLLLSEIQDFVEGRETFALESTLSGKTYARLLAAAKEQGYRIHLHYLWLPSPTIAIARVRQRVKKGGHDVPATDIRRRFHRSLANLVKLYAPLADRWGAWDSQTTPPTLMAESQTCSVHELKAIFL